jgi:hypothetical protein
LPINPTNGCLDPQLHLLQVVVLGFAFEYENFSSKHRILKEKTLFESQRALTKFVISQEELEAFDDFD